VLNSLAGGDLRWRWWELPFHLFVVLPVCLFVTTPLDQFFYNVELYTIWEGIAPCTASVAGLIGFAITWIRPSKSTLFLSVLPLTLVVQGAFETAAGWSHYKGLSELHYVVVNTFGIHPDCEGDCFGGIFTIYTASAFMYSLGAFLAIKTRPLATPTRNGNSRLRS
jgi:hypothetical protein